LSWWVCQCQTQREHLVRLLLMRHGYETYAPRIKVRGRISFLFPAYLFIRAEQRFYTVLWTPGVVRLLMTGDRPSCLVEDIVNNIRKQEKGGFVKPPSTAKILEKGQNIRVTSGSFLGHIGIYDGMNSKDRVRVLLDLLGRKVSVEIGQKDIQPLDLVASA
jgi:transcription antitermination factor NusG